MAERKRIKEELKSSRTPAGRREWRAELEESFEKEKALRAEIATISKKLNADADEVLVRDQILTALRGVGDFVRSLTEDACENLLRITIRRIVVNVPAAKIAEKSPRGIVFSAPIEKGTYLLNVQILESSLAAMLFEHCAEDSTKLGKWLGEARKHTNFSNPIKLRFIAGLPDQRSDYPPFAILPVVFQMPWLGGQRAAVPVRPEENNSFAVVSRAMAWASELKQNPSMSRADIARREGVSRARVTQLLMLVDKRTAFWDRLRTTGMKYSIRELLTLAKTC